MIFTATLNKKEQLQERITRFHFVMPKGVQLEFNPGQYLMVEVGDIRRRPFSIESATKDRTEFSLLVDTSPQGLGSKFFESMEIGKSVEMQGPFGIVTLEHGVSSYLFIATGVGIAPFMPMFERLAESKFSGPIRLVQGAQTAEELLNVEEIKNLQKQFQNFKWTWALTQELSKTQEYFAGRTNIWIEQNYTVSPDELVYVCGGIDMTRDCRAALHAKNAPLKHLKIEVFT